MKKMNRWKAILFPCLSVAGIASVAIPMACLSTVKSHVTMLFTNQRWAQLKRWQNTFTYNFNLSQPIKDGQKIKISYRTTLADQDPCKIEISNYVLTSKTSFKLPVKLVRKDGNELKDKDFALFYLDFELVDSKGQRIWKDSIGYLRIKCNWEVKNDI